MRSVERFVRRQLVASLACELLDLIYAVRACSTSLFNARHRVQIKNIRSNVSSMTSFGGLTNCRNKGSNAAGEANRLAVQRRIGSKANSFFELNHELTALVDDTVAITANKFVVVS